MPFKLSWEQGHSNQHIPKTKMDLKKLWLPIVGGVAIGVYFAMRGFKTNPKGKTAIFIGDSHTAGFGWGWQDTLAKKYGFTFTNLSSVGKTTDWMLKTLKNYPKNADILFIYGGANDAFSQIPNQTALDNIQSMVDLGKAKNVFVVSGYNSDKVSKPKMDASKYPFIEKYDKLKQSFTNINGARVIPIWQGAESKDTDDGMHLNKDAQNRFAQYVGKEIFI
jgi:lysophospholipase L1-like esterase